MKGLSRTKADQRVDVITKLYPNEVPRQVQNARGKTLGELRSGGLSGEKSKQTDKPTSKPMNGKGALAFGKLDREVAQSLLSIDGRAHRWDQIDRNRQPADCVQDDSASRNTICADVPHRAFAGSTREASRQGRLPQDCQAQQSANSVFEPQRQTTPGRVLWNDFRSAGSLVERSLSGSNATDAAITALIKPLRLRSLELGNTSVTDASLGQIASFPALETLGVSRTRVTGDGLKLLAKSPVKQLRAESLGLKDSDIESLSALTRLEELTLLDDTLTGEGFRRFIRSRIVEIPQPEERKAEFSRRAADRRNLNSHVTLSARG